MFCSKYYNSKTLMRRTFLLVQKKAFNSQNNRNTSKEVGYWLLGVSGLVAGMVTVGGVTRLTKSGLSMTDWKLQGTLPPFTNKEWELEFDRYKKFPEWQQRKSMSLAEFKYIYYWEYGHRMMGRFIGLSFTLPGLYFLVKGMIPRALYPRIAMLFSLGGAQGLIGWWMVKSGLEVDPNQKKEIRVSPYRLATHLTMAFTTYFALIWTSLDILYNSAPNAVNQAPSNSVSQFGRRSTRFASHNLALVGLTAISGAFVAGNDAGRAYNTFPTMNGEWVPSEILGMQPLWVNFFENTATVQFDHRVMAFLTFFAITSMYIMGRRGLHGQYWHTLPKTLRQLYTGSVAMVGVQVALGVSTLLLYVPIPLAAAHQAGSLVLLTLATAQLHALKRTFPSSTNHVGKQILNKFVNPSVVNLLRKFPTCMAKSKT